MNYPQNSRDSFIARKVFEKSTENNRPLKIFFTALILFIGLFLTAIAIVDYQSKARTRALQTETERLNKEIPRKPKEVEIGIGLQDFRLICATEDDYQRLESATGTTIVLRYKFTLERQIKNCDGTFTFVNYKLESIYRD